ncbi:hypothetical protein SARC_05910 [Sphaeroforma arctica JP610]|uniref:RRM domain-containing protein n=1 Tax=Sphaeroforma arctica JP610 TaxID=667725 RepID=A0A0L0G0Q4_9EUKA|nr:hypothetical protein SARC_05910 [Sphaeroforma arctica JP610]KNC81788.1 hypothetical protein SARC_05910 [Sphaeroforma arctica JP610]|eukprot:XP_014155690.1 hypothetical protein SARC_05910 [Sphaeroforma arctica JP610]
MSGDLTVVESMSGDLTVVESMSGDLTVVESMSGDLTVVECNQNAGGWRGNHGNHTEWVEPEYTQEEIDAWEAQQKKAQEDFAAQKIAEFKALKAAKATAAATTQHRLNELTKDRIANLLSQQKTLMAEIATMDKTAKKEAMKKLMGFVDEMKKLRQQMEIRKSAAIAQKPTPAPLPPVASAYAALNQPLPGSRKQSTYRSAAVLASDELKRLQLDNELNAIAQGNSETPTDTPHAAPVDPPAQPPRTYTPTNTPQTAQQTPMQAAAQAHVKPMARTVSANPLVTSNSIYISGVSSAEDIEQLRQMLLKFGPLAQESAMTVRGKGIVASYAMKESCAKVLAAGIVLNGKKLPMVLWVTPTANPTPAPAASVSAIENDDQIV